jgi:hypothetical protein
MPRQTTEQKRKAKIAKRVAIVAGVLALLTFVMKEILRENLKELHDSVAHAEAQFRTEEGQSTIQIQIQLIQQQIELARAQADPQRGNPNRDFGPLIAQALPQSQMAIAQVNNDFDSASRLVDALPFGKKQWRAARDQVRAALEKTRPEIEDMIKPSTDHDLKRFVGVKMAMVLALLAEIPITVLADRALTAAHETQEALDKLIRFCSWAVYCLGLLTLSLGLYAAISGIKAGSGE